MVPVFFTCAWPTTVQVLVRRYQVQLAIIKWLLLPVFMLLLLLLVLHQSKKVLQESDFTKNDKTK